MTINSNISVGEIFNTKTSGSALILDNLGRGRYLVEFQDTKYRTEVGYHAIKEGSVRDYEKPLLCGVGIVGKPKASKTSAYKKWADMIARCYSSRSGIKERKPYTDVFVSDDFKHFLNFEEWFYSQKACHQCKWQLDKDLLGCGKLYSRENCTLLPVRLNNIIKESSNDNVEILTSNRYRARVCGKQIGIYANYQDAKEAVLVRKKNIISELLLEYGDFLETRTYLALEQKYNN